jgi:hypothetical protein
MCYVLGDFNSKSHCRPLLTHLLARHPTFDADTALNPSLLHTAAAAGSPSAGLVHTGTGKRKGLVFLTRHTALSAVWAGCCHLLREQHCC